MRRIVAVLVVSASWFGLGAAGPAAAAPTSPFAIVTGAGASGDPQVSGFDPTGAAQFSFFAYTPSFTGGVRVAAGDVNGDGTPDIITAPGPGGSPDVRVFDGTNHTLINEFFAYTPSFTGGVYVAAGDINGDGHADIITGTDAGGSPDVKVFSGADLTLLGEFFAYTPSFTGGVRVAAGDVNGDGTPDIITAPGPGGSPDVRVFDGTNHTLINEFFAYTPSFTGGVYVAAGDINGDGHADIITGTDAGGSPDVKVFSGADLTLLGEFFAYTPSFTGGVRVAAGDVNGDGTPDIITAPGPGGSPDVRVFDGTNHTLINEFFAYTPSFTGGVYVAAPAGTLTTLLDTLLTHATGIGAGRSLADKAKNVRAELAGSDTTDACSTLHAMRNEIRAQTGKHLTAADAQRLTTDISNVENAIPC